MVAGKGPCGDKADTDHFESGCESHTRVALTIEKTIRAQVSATLIGALLSLSRDVGVPIGVVKLLGC